MFTTDEYGWTIMKGDNGYGMAESYRTIMVQGPVQKYVKQKKCAVEIGTYYGFTTRWLSSNFETVIAFDLDTDVAECFRQNMEKFACTNVTFYATPLSDREKYINTTNLTSTHMNKNFETHKDRTFFAKTLDSYEIPNIDFLIIDTEGHEHDTLLGSYNSICRSKPVIICKFHNSMNEAEHILIKKLNYKFIQQVSKNDRLYVHQTIEE